eukprot:TRINITY_DN4371_c0_g1_i1.p1 TRINITY_DN4371_c0_g1~~TRINITY_DN4371_c0_g1_i1.p1  ORF type:complete len:522 (+),score=116.21 TRINITY_DN4371_c0_g1_i1:162-1568(+)
MAAAQTYSIERLMQICEQYLQNQINLTNVFKLLRYSNDLQVKRAKDLCLNFTSKNPAVLANTEGAKELGLNLFQEVVLGVQNPPGVIPPIEITAPDTVGEDFYRLFEQRRTNGDVFFLIDNNQIPAHRALLAGKSKKFIDVIDAAGSKNIVRLSHTLSTDAFMSVLRWVYYADEDIDPLSATQLIEFAKSYNLSVLRKLCEEKVRHNINSTTVLPILNVASLSVLDDNPSLKNELVSNSLDYVVKHLKEIDFSPLHKAAHAMDGASTGDPRASLPGIIAVDILLALQGGNTNFASNTSKKKISKKKSKHMPRPSISSVDESTSHDIDYRSTPPNNIPPPPDLIPHHKPLPSPKNDKVFRTLSSNSVKKGRGIPDYVPPPPGPPSHTPHPPGPPSHTPPPPGPPSHTPPPPGPPSHVPPPPVGPPSHTPPPPNTTAVPPPRFSPPPPLENPPVIPGKKKVPPMVPKKVK